MTDLTVNSAAHAHTANNIFVGQSTTQTLYWAVVPSAIAYYTNTDTDAAKIVAGLGADGSALAAGTFGSQDYSSGTIIDADSPPTSQLTQGTLYKVVWTIFDGEVYGGGGGTKVAVSEEFTTDAVLQPDDAEHQHAADGDVDVSSVFLLPDDVQHGHVQANTVLSDGVPAGEIGLYWVVAPSAAGNYANDDTDAAKIAAGLDANGASLPNGLFGSQVYVSGTVIDAASPPTTELTQGALYKIAWTTFDGTTFGNVTVSAEFAAEAVLVVDAADHGHAAEGVTLDAGIATPLVVGDVTHGHAVEVPVLGYTVSVEAALPGAEATADAGAIASSAGTGANVALTGAGALAAAGSVFVAAGGSNNVELAGASAVGAAGGIIVSAVRNTAVTIPGAAAVAQAAPPSVSAGGDAYASLTGAATQSFAGALVSYGAGVASLVGSGVQAYAGLAGASGAASSALPGAAAEAAAGPVLAMAQGSAIVYVTGASAASAASAIYAEGEISYRLRWYEAPGANRVYIAPGSNRTYTL